MPDRGTERRERERARYASDPEYRERKRASARASGRNRRPQPYIYRERTDVDRARQAVADALRRSKMVKPECCERCGAAGKVEGHHADYSRRLDVEWLCPMCHHSEQRRFA